MTILRAILVFVIILGVSDADARGKRKRRVKRYKCRHTVLPGETLKKVASRYNISIRRLKAINSLKSDRIKAGRKLGIVSRLPCPKRYHTTYVVKRGDSWKRIAKKHGIPRRMLRGLNPKKGRRLRAGQKLVLVLDGPGPAAAQGGFVQLHSGPGFEVRRGSRAWGTSKTVSNLIQVLTAHHSRFPKKSPIKVDDISIQHGGKLEPHLSHRHGRDVDIRFPLTVDTKAYVKANAKTLDLRRAWDLIHAFLKTKDVVYIFVDYKLQKLLYAYALKKGVSEEKLKKYFQYPRAKKAMQGIVRHEPGHATHMHVRFKKAKRRLANSQ